MNTIIRIVLLSGLIFLSGCNKRIASLNNVDMIDFPNVSENFRISECFSEISCVQLEQTEQSVIGAIDKIIVLEDEIIVLADNEILAFDKKSGGFLRQIGSQGEGSEEYIRIKDIFYNSDDRSIEAYDRYRNVFFRYSITGEFLGKKTAEFKDTWIASFVKVQDGTILACNMLTDSPEATAFTVIRENGKVMNIDPISPIHVGDYVAKWASKPMSSFNGEMKFIKLFSDTIYSIYKDDISPIAKLDFGKPMPSKEDISQLGPYPGDPDFMEFCSKNNYMTSIDKMFETSRYIVLLPTLYYLQGYFWIDKESTSGFHFNSSPIFDVETQKAVEGRSIINIAAANKNELVSCFVADPVRDSFIRAFKSSEGEIALPDSVVRAIENVDPDGNPFLIIYSH